MATRIPTTLLFAIAVALPFATGCGSDDDQDESPGSPLSGDVSGTFLGRAFTPRYGVAVQLPDATTKVELSMAKISCQRNGLIDESLNGLFAHFAVPSLAPGTYSNVFLEFDQRARNEATVGGGITATLTLDSVTGEAISGSVSYAFIDDALNGTFGVPRCPAH